VIDPRSVPPGMMVTEAGLKPVPLAVTDAELAPPATGGMAVSPATAIAGGNLGFLMHPSRLGRPDGSRNLMTFS
jgi:hypothetical protein